MLRLKHRRPICVWSNGRSECIGTPLPIDSGLAGRPPVDDNGRLGGLSRPLAAAASKFEPIVAVWVAVWHWLRRNSVAARPGNVDASSSSSSCVSSIESCEQSARFAWAVERKLDNFTYLNLEWPAKLLGSMLTLRRAAWFRVECVALSLEQIEANQTRKSFVIRMDAPSDRILLIVQVPIDRQSGAKKRCCFGKGRGWHLKDNHSFDFSFQFFFFWPCTASTGHQLCPSIDSTLSSEVKRFLFGQTKIKSNKDGLIAPPGRLL